MTPRILLDTAVVPSGGELRLYRRGDAFSITLGGNELMNSRLSGSEEALATLACAAMPAPVPATTPPSILIGGLGMGFTLRAALAVLGPEARVTVVELVPAVVTWARDHMHGVFAGCLDDPRVTIVERDVGQVIAEAAATYDAILLDVDNGPDGLTRAGNDRLYDAAGLTAARRALTPGGILAIWSAASDAGFTDRLRRAGYTVEEVAVRAHGQRGARHVIWLARSS